MWSGKKKEFNDRVVHVNQPNLNTQYKSNRVFNTKYTPLSFLPLNLMEQFSRHMNRYFLFIACLQLFHTITPVHPASTWVPLITVLSLSAAKEGFDDIRRSRRDKIVNSRRVRVIKGGGETTISSAEICVGDLVRVGKDEEAPCDLCVVASSNDGGSCYIQTSNLDGETDYKQRVALQSTQRTVYPPPRQDPLAEEGAVIQNLTRVKGMITCNLPNAEVYEFNARLDTFSLGDHSGGQTTQQSLSSHQLVQQSAFLKHTDWFWGVAVYTGNETKLGMNKKKPQMKWTSAENFINHLSLFVFLFQLGTVVLFGVFGNYLLFEEQPKMSYLSVEPFDRNVTPWYQPAIVPARFLLLCSMMIPISLKVTLDFVRAFYAKTIEWDQELFDKKKGMGAVSNNTAIGEELGQIGVVLTDKTGTLTENTMRFNKCVIGNTMYGYGQYNDASEDVRLREKVNARDKEVTFFFRALALCHTVVPQIKKDGTYEYRSASPDEEALVLAAREFGVVFESRVKDKITLEIAGKKESYEVLHVLEFSSNRKRMSVLLRTLENPRLMLFTKGADDVILQRLQQQNQDPDSSLPTPEDHARTGLESFSSLGLRTLCVAWRTVDENEYKSFREAYQMASSALRQREQQIQEVYTKLETNLKLLGITAIEDKLQDRVPETISDLRAAGIRFWMLTGDKYSTALQIATACRLHAPHRHLISFREQIPKEEMLTQLDQHLEESKKRSSRHQTMIVASTVIAQVLEDQVLSEKFVQLAQRTQAVVCSRVTPLQKALIVQLVKRTKMVTLAIGDGGNDVNMIQEAHVGVGIHGREGVQAARAADYTIMQFHYLKRLILVHGRWSYHRTAFIAQYSFYKSLIICFLQLSFAFFSSFSGASLFNSLSLMGYNVFYTGLLACFFVLDRDIEAEDAMKYPTQYRAIAKMGLLNKTTFLWWFIRAFFQARVVWEVTHYAIKHHVTADGKVYGDEEFGLIAFSALVWIQVVTIYLESSTVTSYNFALLIGTLGVFHGFNALFSLVPSLSMYGLMFHLYCEPVYWLVGLLSLVLAVVPVMTIQVLVSAYKPTPRQVRRAASRSVIGSKNLLANRGELENL